MIVTGLPNRIVGRAETLCSSVLCQAQAVAGAGAERLQGGGSIKQQLQHLERCGALRLRGPSSDVAASVQRRCWSVAWSRKTQKQQLRRPGALQERPVASEAADSACRSTAGAFRGLRGRKTRRDPTRNGESWKQKVQTKKEYRAAVAASGGVAGELTSSRSTSWSSSSGDQ